MPELPATFPPARGSSRADALKGLMSVPGSSPRPLSQAQSLSSWVPPFLYTDKLETQLPPLPQLSQLSSGRHGDWARQTESLGASPQNCSHFSNG